MFACTGFWLGVLSLAAQGTTLPSGDSTSAPDQPATHSLAAEHKELIPALIATLAEDDQQTRSDASAALVALGREALPALMRAIEGENDVIGARAAWAVGNMASSGGYLPAEAIPVLIKALKVDDAGVKQAAAHAIKEIVVASTGGQNGRFFGRGGGGFGSRSRN